VIEYARPFNKSFAALGFIAAWPAGIFQHCLLIKNNNGTFFTKQFNSLTGKRIAASQKIK
jgi:hypothetical protein